MCIWSDCLTLILTLHFWHRGMVWHLQFSQWCGWGFTSCGMWHCVTGWMVFIALKGKQPEKILWNAMSCSPNDTAWHPRRHESSCSSLLHNQQIFVVQVSFRCPSLLHNNQTHFVEVSFNIPVCHITNKCFFFFFYKWASNGNMRTNL
jgi:hypothetical protein